MMRIGEVAKQFDISNRTLRHWEEMGILESVRAENSYRYYDENNLTRIKQIVLLRKLKMPIADIEQIFIADNLEIAIELLIKHLESLKHDVRVYYSLITIIEKLIKNANDVRNLSQVFYYLEMQNVDVTSENDIISQIKLSERTNLMIKERLDNVRIVKLPAMIVAAYQTESVTPENDCSKIMDPFIFENKLDQKSGYRNFGFNNPDPNEGESVYGYEMWVTIPGDFQVSLPLTRKEVEGGLYASISTTLSEIGERWELLFIWCTDNNKYEADFSRQWLEECTMDLKTFISEETPISEKQLDLLMPIKVKEH
jgi:DNA-binding transcriptional MerR regulator